MMAGKRGRGPGRLAIFAAIVLSAGLAAGTAAAQDGQRKFVLRDVAGGDADESAPKPGDEKQEVIIRAIEPESGKREARDLTWLGVSVEDVPEALTDQLGLKHGEGMVVSYVSADSPAAKAELRKHDVLVGLDDQMLVDPAQLRKLVQMHQDGDSVKITFYRAGKKQSVTAKLVKKKWNENAMDAGPLQDGMKKFELKLDGLKVLPDGLDEEMSGLAESLKRLGLDKQQMKIEIEQTMEQTRKAIQDAMKHSQDAVKHSQDGQNVQEELRIVSKQLADLAGGGVDLGKDTTVVIKKDGKSAKTIVQTDDSGSYVIVADPQKRLTARDKHGKVLFDGAIESPEEQKKVPQDIWEKIKPVLDQMDKEAKEIGAPAPPKDAPEK